MSWTPLHFGQHKGKTLPQVIFSDPDWFFWAIEQEIFQGSLAKEARDLRKKARNIRVPQKDDKTKLVAEYAIHPPTGTFGHMEIVPNTRPNHVGTTVTYRKEVIDLKAPREISKYDKLGCRNMLKSVKYYLFGKENARMTKRRCEEFFENDDNFDLHE